MTKYFDEEWPKEEEILKIGLEQSRRNKADRFPTANERWPRGGEVIQGKKRVFLIGNGLSRKDFDLTPLKKYGKVYGCNAIWRDELDKIDVLTAVDNGVIHEIYHNGIAQKIPCWFRNWTKIPTPMYESVVEGMIGKQELEELKDYDVITENERGMSQEFVMHGANLAGQVKILRNAKKETPRGDKEIIKKQINHNTLYVSWIKEPDYSKDIRECWSEYKDHGWACGASAGFIACKEEKPDEVYLIGHDLVSDTEKVNNLFAGTKHYVAKENGPTPHVNWVGQWYDLFAWNQNIKFFKVNKSADNLPTNQHFREWLEWSDKKVLSYMTQAELLDKMRKW